MSRRAAIAEAEARLRQLCCLGLPGPVIAPAVFRELNAVLPFETCFHMWIGPDGPCDAYFDNPEAGPRFALYRDEICHPSGGDVFLRVMVRDGAVPVGAYNVARLTRDRDFDADDLRTLRRLEPYLAHALRTRDEPATPETCTAERVIVVVDQVAEVRWRSPEADRLLSLANGHAVAAARLPEGLLRAVQAWVEITREQADAKVPVWRHHNAWGTFVARAYPLDPTASDESLIGIELERRVPLPLVLFEALRATSMPARQAEVGLLLALGHTQEQIAERLHVTRHTVVYHRRQIYNRLGVDSRHALQERLLHH